MAECVLLLYAYSPDPRRGPSEVQQRRPGGVVVVRCPSPSPFPAVGVICRGENDPEVAAKALLLSRWAGRASP
ncbi:hypothetical protein E2562_005991 [Oryza meyeriana var. granulata]|uniref:Uncharacterized protein n=1 Tax=Oryza meyeriana var. granulata TaxID=110450 RepID=A0A6G1EVB9_9ORYZ|nr:hypothetical protein E2562_005991 [Oryza meyeriana var. granulata]